MHYAWGVWVGMFLALWLTADFAFWAALGHATGVIACYLAIDWFMGWLGRWATRRGFVCRAKGHRWMTAGLSSLVATCSRCGDKRSTVLS